MTLQAIDTLDHSGDETVLADPHQTAKPPVGGAKATATLPKANQAKHVPAGTGAAYWGPRRVNDVPHYRQGERRLSGGSFFMSEISVAPGGGTPPHIHHREDDPFRVLEGTRTIQVGGDTITASAGDFAFLPR